MAYEFITVNEHHDGQVREIVLGPPPANIVSAAVIREMESELVAIADNAALKLLIIRGDGDHFSYGASVEEHQPDQVEDMLMHFHAFLRHLLSCPVPSLAVVKGLCLGGGFEVALACSMVACEEDAKFGVPEIKLGVFPPAGSVLLSHRVSPAAASDMVLTGRNVSGRDMYRMGVANILAESGTLDDAVTGFITRHILPKSASSLRLAWQAVRVATLQHYKAHIDAVEKLYLKDLMSTHDAVEGIDAFLAKRSPEWQDA